MPAAAEIGLLDRWARPATVTVESDIIAHAISKERFAALLDKNPLPAQNMFTDVRDRSAD